MDSPSPASDLPRLSCMEVWGGNSASESAVRLPGVDAWVFSEPYSQSEFGGDVHYVSSCASGRITRFLLADVSGHGMPVAAIADDLRTIMRRNINRIDQTRLVEAVNEEFRPLHQRGTHATAIAGTYFLPRERLTICNAGHPSTFLYRASERRWMKLEPVLHEGPEHRPSPTTVLNIPLGILPNSSWTPIELRFRSDDLLLLYTDSAIEACDGEGNEIGDDGLLRIVEDCHRDEPATLVRDVVARLRSETRHKPFEDDLSLVLLRGTETTTRLQDDLLSPFRYLADSFALAAGTAG